MTTKATENGTQPDAQIDLATVSDVNYLKAMAYDRLALIEQAQAELRVINGRIGDLATNEP